MSIAAALNTASGGGATATATAAAAAGQKQKRKRRSFSELKRNVVCPHKSCKRRYASAHALHQHIRIKHAGDGIEKNSSSSSTTTTDGSGVSSPDALALDNYKVKNNSNLSSPSSVLWALLGGGGEESDSSSSSIIVNESSKNYKNSVSKTSSPSKRNNAYRRSKSEGSGLIKDVEVEAAAGKGKKRRKRSKSLNSDTGFNFANLGPISLDDLELSDIYQDSKIKLPGNSLFSFRNTSTSTLTCIPSKIWGTEEDKINSQSVISGNESSLSTALDFFDENFTFQIFNKRDKNFFNNLLDNNNNTSNSTSANDNIFNTCSTPSSYIKTFELDEHSLLQSIIKDNLKGMA